MSNPRNWDQAAGLLWPHLTKAAAAGTLLTYGDLAPLIETNPLNVGEALGPIQFYCMDARLPPLTAIVVNKATGRPGAGFIAWDADHFSDAAAAVFGHDWSRLENPFIGFIDGETEQSLAQKLNDAPDEAGEVYRRIRDRGVAQRVFRRALLDAYGAECCICGLSFEETLEAAHVTSWGDCDAAAKLDPRNGLLLCGNHHRMFDRQLISVRPDYRVEYYDPDAKDGPYSRADEDASLRLHGRRIRLPADPRLHPDVERLRRRRRLDEWDEIVPADA